MAADCLCGEALTREEPGLRHHRGQWGRGWGRGLGWGESQACTLFLSPWIKLPLTRMLMSQLGASMHSPLTATRFLFLATEESWLRERKSDLSRSQGLPPHSCVAFTRGTSNHQSVQETVMLPCARTLSCVRAAVTSMAFIASMYDSQTKKKKIFLL